MKHLNLLKSTLLLCALVVGSTSMWGQTAWVKTEISELSNNHVIVVLETAKYNKALLNTEATSSGSVKASDALTLSADGKTISSSVAADIQWVFNGTSSSFTLKSNDADARQLWSRDNNDALRVKATSPGSSYRGTFTYDDEYHMMKSTEYTRYVGVWKNSDTDYQWRAYSSQTSTNIKGTETYFYRLSIPVTFAAGKTMISFSDATNAIDLTTANLPSGLAAYRVSAADASSVTLTAVNSTVAKNTGVILIGTAGETYNIPVVGSGTDISGSNLLVASNGTDNVTSAYVLSDGKFHPVAAAGVVIPAGKAYLPAGSLSAHELDITFDNGDVTGIEAVETQKAFDGAFYNLNGQRVAQPAKGLYIVNGKKVVLK